MAANTTPVFPLTGNVGFGKIITANTGTDGTGSNVVAIFTAGTNGSRVDAINFWHLGTNVATVARLFINNGASVGTATNNVLWFETTMAANTISQVAASIQVTSLPGTASPFLPILLPANYVIYASVGTTIASGIGVSIQGGNL